jgi:hypothetical protein
MMIIDAGAHVWRPEAPDRPWMPGRKAHLPEPLTYEKFSAMMKGPASSTPSSFLPRGKVTASITASKRRKNIPIGLR